MPPRSGPISRPCPTSLVACAKFDKSVGKPRKQNRALPRRSRAGMSDDEEASDDAGETYLYSSEWTSIKDAALTPDLGKCFVLPNRSNGWITSRAYLSWHESSGNLVHCWMRANDLRVEGRGCDGIVIGFGVEEGLSKPYLLVVEGTTTLVQDCKRERKKHQGADTDDEDDKMEALESEEIKAMKVPDLKAALEDRGLDTKGKKAELVERLLAALVGPRPRAKGGAGEGDGEEEEERNFPSERLP